MHASMPPCCNTSPDEYRPNVQNWHAASPSLGGNGTHDNFTLARCARVLRTASQCLVRPVPGLSASLLCVSVRLSLSFLFLCCRVYLYVCRSFRLPASSAVCLPINPCVCQSIFQPVSCLFVCLSLCLPRPKLVCFLRDDV